MDPKTKYQLFRQRKHFCTAPWNLLYVGVDGSVKSCTFGKVLGNVTKQDLNEIQCNKEFTALKQDILDDKITDNCKECIHAENNTSAGKFDSLRNHYNKTNIDSSVDYTDASKFKLASLDLHWSSVCDFKCVTCWAVQSSSIAREENKPVNHTPTEVAERIIEYVVANQTELKEIYMSGGEPTLIKHNLKLLKQIEKRPDLLIRVNSNMNWNQDNAILQEILKFPNVLFTCSIDGMDSKFNYIRQGGNWNKTLENIKFLQKQPNVDLRANTVFFVLTAQELPSIIDYFMEEIGSIDHTINQLAMGQDHLRCRNLPVDIKSKVKQNLNTLFKKYENNLSIAGNLQNCLLELDNDNDGDQYKAYFDRIDSRRGTNWRELYPELT